LIKNLIFDEQDRVFLVDVGDLRGGTPRTLRFDQAEIAALILFLLTGSSTAPVQSFAFAPGITDRERWILVRAVRCDFTSIRELRNALQECLKERSSYNERQYDRQP
jgi:hypothetical protein